jgi:hypothetical protein
VQRAAVTNPWEEVPLYAYEAHMASPQVGQLQALSNITRRQLKRYMPRSVCVLGVAGGNGLEHVDLAVTEKVYAVDISAEYLDACARRFAALGDRLELLRMDLCHEACRLPGSDLVIANLVIEYTGVEAFARLTKHARPAAVCCAVQASCGEGFVSASPCADALQCLDEVHQDVEPGALAAAMACIGYRQTFREEVALLNGKRLVCIDFAG